MVLGDFPKSWYTTDTILSNNIPVSGAVSDTDCAAFRMKEVKRCYNILILPWHQYINLSFTHRAIFNPALSFFSRMNVLQGDNIEVSQDLYSQSAKKESFTIE